MAQRKRLITGGAAVLIGFWLAAGVVDAGSKTLEPGKRDVYQDDTYVSMKEVLAKRDSETKEYKDQMLKNSEETVQLLKEIRDELKKSNAKK